MTHEEAIIAYRQSLDRFVHETGFYPKRLLISFKNWIVLIGDGRNYVNYDSPYSAPRYEELEVIRTGDADVLEVLK